MDWHVCNLILINVSNAQLHRTDAFSISNLYNSGRTVIQQHRWDYAEFCARWTYSFDWMSLYFTSHKNEIIILSFNKNCTACCFESVLCEARYPRCEFEGPAIDLYGSPAIPVPLMPTGSTPKKKKKPGNGFSSHRFTSSNLLMRAS